jgi:hypothetical protein
MKKTVFEIYSSLVCFVTIICCSVWLGIGLYSLAGIFEPEITMDSWRYQRHQSNQYFQPLLGEPIILEPPSAIEVIKPESMNNLSDNEISKKRLESYQLDLQSEVRKNQQELIKSLIAVFICLPLFFLHWRFVRPK